MAISRHQDKQKLQWNMETDVAYTPSGAIFFSQFAEKFPLSNKRLAFENSVLILFYFETIYFIMKQIHLFYYKTYTSLL